MNKIDINQINSQENTISSKEQKYLQVSWDSYKVSILSLAIDVYRLGWEPDYIICPGRGAMDLSQALSRLFGKTVGVLMCYSYKGEGEREKGNLIIAEHISITKKLKGKILIADDLVDTGDTFIKIMAFVKDNYPEMTELKTAAIYKKTNTTYTPDYFAEVVDADLWIDLPNEIFDKICLKHIPQELLKKLSKDHIKELAQRILSSLPSDPNLSLAKECYTNFALELLMKSGQII